jgi:hypothetical protein
MLLRVTVTETWETVDLVVAAGTSVREVKQEALRRGLHAEPDLGAYEVKFRGALVVDEDATLETVGVPSGAALIVLPARRRPVR